MKNFWLKDKVVSKGHDYWTFEVYDASSELIVSEIIVSLDELPSMKVTESLQVIENGKKAWKPALMVWEKFEVTYTDVEFINSDSQSALLKVNGDAVGILRHYNQFADLVESWVLQDLRLTDIDFPKGAVTAEFTFHNALFNGKL